MNTPVFSYKNAESFFDKQELDQMGKRAVKAMEELESGTGRGNDFLGWLHLPENYDRDEFERVKKASEKIRSNSKALIVIGIFKRYAFQCESRRNESIFCGQQHQFQLSL